MKDNPDFNWKKYAIEIGYDADLNSKSNMDYEQALEQINKHFTSINSAADSTIISYNPTFDFEKKEAALIKDTLTSN